MSIDNRLFPIDIIVRCGLCGDSTSFRTKVGGDQKLYEDVHAAVKKDAMEHALQHVMTHGFKPSSPTFETPNVEQHEVSYEAVEPQTEKNDEEVI